MVEEGIVSKILLRLSERSLRKIASLKRLTPLHPQIFPFPNPLRGDLPPEIPTAFVRSIFSLIAR
jgi:hypothetical protein